jgi:hypothetical protein
MGWLFPSQLVLVVIHIAEEIHCVSIRAADDCLIWVCFETEAAVHPDAEVDFVANLVESRPVAFSGNKDAAVWTGLGSGAAPQCNVRRARGASS